MKINKIMIMAACAVMAAAVVAGCTSKSASENDNEGNQDVEEAVVKDISEEDNAAIDAATFAEIGKGGVGEVTNQDVFLEYIKSPVMSKPVVIDLNATWCGPCQNFKPTFEKVAEEYGDRAEFFSVDVDKCPAIAEFCEASAIPKVVILRAGKDPVTNVGLLSEDEFKDLLDSAIK